MRRKVLILVNPQAGGGRALRAEPRVAAYLKGLRVQADFARPASVRAFEQSAKEGAAAGYNCIASLGGDGTFQHLVRGTLGVNVPLGYLPSGGGNDVAEALEIPADPVAAAHTLVTGVTRAVDILRVRCADGATGLYVGGGGLGLDAEAARLASGRFRAWPGAARYIAAALISLAHFKPPRVEVRLDGGPLAASGPVLLAAVVNTPIYGAGVRIAPAAQVDDGMLDVALVAPLAWTRVLEVIPALLSTGDARVPEIQRFCARRVELRADHASPFHGDGELLGTTPLEIECLHKAIRVIVNH
jgi:diacylglycerol kinase (ATP)